MRDANRSQSGQSLLEFALVLPVLALMLLGIVDFGQIFSRWLVVEHAARDAARYASLGGSADQATTMAEQEAGGNATATVTLAPYTVPQTGNQTGNSPALTQVTVTIQSPVPLFDPLLMTLLGNPYSVKSTVTMLVE